AKVLCGLGVPDARGGYVSYFVYTTDELWFARDITDTSSAGPGTGSGGYKLRVDERDGVVETKLYGPSNFWRVPKLSEELADVVRRREATESYKKAAELE